MNRSQQRLALEHARQRDTWLRVYNHEMTRRKRLLAERPQKAEALLKRNRKGVADTCAKHSWVAARLLWIHDSMKKGGKQYHEIDGIYRRGFHEAASYRLNGYEYTPQMCMYCVAARELIKEPWSWTKDQQRHKQLEHELEKPRGKMGRDIMLDDLEDLFWEKKNELSLIS